MDITEVLAFSAQQGASDLHLSATRNLIREDKVAQMRSAIKAGQTIGMQTMDQCLKGLVAKRIITAQAAREKAQELDSMAF